MAGVAADDGTKRMGPPRWERPEDGRGEIRMDFGLLEKSKKDFTFSVRKIQSRSCAE